jgi:hypothetical protein
MVGVSPSKGPAWGLVARGSAYRLPAEVGAGAGHGALPEGASRPATENAGDRPGRLPTGQPSL